MNTSAMPSEACLALANNSLDLIARHDRNHRYVYVNPAYETALGIPSTLLRGKTLSEAALAAAIPDALTQAIQEGLTKATRSASPNSVDVSWHDDMTGSHWFTMQAIPELDTDGLVAGVLTILRDDSFARRAEHDLSLLNFAINHMAEALYLVDEDGNFVYINEEACQALGYVREELLRMTVFDIDPNFSPDRWREDWQRLMASHVISCASHHRTKNGHILPVEIKSTHFAFCGRDYNLTLAQDVTKRQYAEDELRRREHEFRTLVENSPDTIARYDRDCRRRYVNPAMVELIGAANGELLGQRPSDQICTAAARSYEDAIRLVVESGQGREYEYSGLTPDGRTFTNHIRLTPEFDLAGNVVSVFAVGRDISALKESERRLRQAEAMAHIGHWHWDCIRLEAHVSEEVCRILGHASTWKPTLIKVLTTIVDDDRDRVQSIYRNACIRREQEVSHTCRCRSSGGILHLHVNTHIDYDANGLPIRLVGTIQDISELKNYESRLNEVAFYDILTGLPNRALLNDRLQQSVAESSRRDQILGLLVLDLDRFKEINDTHGHGIGDRVLYESAERLRELVREYDTVARIGGDEFAIVLPDIRTPADLGTISGKILTTFARPFNINSQDLYVSASIGIAVFPIDCNAAADLLQYADSALYDAKSRGRSCFRFYSSELTSRAKERASLELALRSAESEGELELFYQPKIDLINGHLTGAEALLRWHHPTLGLLTPDRFIGIAEDTGLIVGIGTWVLTKACMAAQKWNQNRLQNLKIAVNLSSRQFREYDLVSTVRSVLTLTGCKPEWLELEITESLLLGDDEGVRTTLDTFQAMGISIAIDDFGTGYSSLSYLKRFPIDALKIDRSFINDVTVDQDSTELVKAIITMANSLHLYLVAEGIETEAQEHFLQTHGCHLGQGYRYGKPIPLSDFEGLLSRISLYPATTSLEEAAFGAS